MRHDLPNYCFNIGIISCPVGTEGSGRASLITRYVKDEYHEQSLSSIKIHSGAKNHTVDSATTAQIRVRKMRPQDSMPVDAIIVTLDLTKDLKKPSLDTLRTSLEKIRAMYSPQTPLILVGTKSDWPGERKMPHTEVMEQWGRENGSLISYTETSAKMGGETINSLFQKICIRLVRDLQRKEAEQALLASNSRTLLQFHTQLAALRRERNAESNYRDIITSLEALYVGLADEIKSPNFTIHSPCPIIASHFAAVTETLRVCQSPAECSQHMRDLERSLTERLFIKEPMSPAIKVLIGAVIGAAIGFVLGLAVGTAITLWGGGFGGLLAAIVGAKIGSAVVVASITGAGLGLFAGTGAGVDISRVANRVYKNSQVSPQITGLIREVVASGARPAAAVAASCPTPAHSPAIVAVAPPAPSITSAARRKPNELLGHFTGPAALTDSSVAGGAVTSASLTSGAPAALAQLPQYPTESPLPTSTLSGTRGMGPVTRDVTFEELLAGYAARRESTLTPGASTVPLVAATASRVLAASCQRDEIVAVRGGSLFVPFAARVTPPVASAVNSTGLEGLTPSDPDIQFRL